jgi:uncharacterized protein (TIGR02145 family)
MKHSIVMVIMLGSFGGLTAQTNYEIKIGEQQWMANDLAIIKFRNGDKIKQAQTVKSWERAIKTKTPAWCYYEDNKNEPNDTFPRAILYNRFAISDSRGLAPDGWRLPTVRDFENLAQELGGEDSVGEKIKSKSGWDDDKNGNDILGFRAYPRGVLNGGRNGEFEGKGRYVFWWSIDTNKIVGVDYSSNSLRFISEESNTGGNSVRCIKKTPEEIQIGKQIWKTQDLRLKKFRNGDTLLKVHNKEEWKFANKNKIPAYTNSYFMNDSELVATNLGFIYNVYALNDKRNIAPEGFHITSNEDWEELSLYYGGDNLAYKKLAHSKYFWRGSGSCTKDGEFLGDGLWVGWWTTSTSKDKKHSVRILNYYDAYLNSQIEEEYESGYAIRCLKD